MPLPSPLERPAGGRCRVALFIPHLAVGGSELQLLTLARGLPARGFDPVVATLDRRDRVAERFEADRVEVVALPRRGWSGLDSVLALARLVRDRGIPIVHAWLWAANWRAAVARSLAPKLRVIFSVRSLEEDLGAAHSLAYRGLAPLASRILVNSEAIRERSMRRTGRPAGAYDLVRNGIDLEALDRAARTGAAGPEAEPVVGYLGSLAARKRVEALARIAPAIVARVPRARFLVVGDGDRRDALLEECRRVGVEDRFELVGRQEDVGRWLARMSVLVHPSVNEGSSNAVLEAQAVGVPVVAYAVSGNRETVLHRETGVLVPDGEEGALADSVIEILTRPEIRRAMSERARAFVRTRFSVDAMVDATAAAYRGVLGRAG